MESLPYRLEIEARQQIREHLDDHVQKHLAIDSDDYTIREAEKLLSGILRPVPSTGPTDIGPPKDFVESLLDDPSSSKLSFLEDRLSISSSVFQWLKQLKAQLSPVERARAERDLSRFALDDTIHSLSPHHPMDLLMSRRSKHQTPTIGDGASVNVLPSALKDVESRLGLSPVVLPAVEEPVLNQEHILSAWILVNIAHTVMADCIAIVRSLRFSLDTQTKTAIGNLLSSLPQSIISANRPTRIASSRRQEFTPAAIIDFLHNDDPAPFVSNRMSPPLFPRVPPSLARRNQVLGNDLSDLHKLIGGKVDIEQDELDHVQESFKLVDGLNAIPELSSSTVNSDVTSPESSQRGGADRYWCPSSDGPDVGLDQWKMEEFEFPRSRRIGQATSDLAARAPGITSMQDIIGDPVPGDAQFPPKWNDGLLGQMSHSVLGASASIAEDKEDKMDLDDVDSLLVQVYKDVQTQDPFSLILKEKVDQRDSWLMEVPDLPEPCGRSSSLPALPHLSIMLAPPVKKGERPSEHEGILEEGLSFKLRLRKVGGMRINLSWSPFIRGETTIPTLESVTGVEGDLTLESQSTDFLRETQVLLSAPRKEGAERFEDPGAASPRVEDQSLEPILLSRLELRRLASTQRNYEIEASDDEDEELDELEDSDIEMVDEAVHTHSVSAQKEDFRQQPVQRDVAQQSKPDQANPELLLPITFVMEAIPALPALPAPVTHPTPSDPTSLSSKPNRIPSPTTKSTAGSAVSVTATPNKLSTNSNKSKLLQFLNLRGRTLPLENEQELPVSPQKGDLPPPQSSPNHLQELPKIPEEVLTHCSFHIDRKTSVSLPQTVVYKYIASFNMIQKRGICYYLNSGPVGIYLVERPNLTDVDLIVDAGAAIIYLTLSALPAEASNIVERVSRISPAYSRLLLVFEAYPPSKSRTAPLTDLDDARTSKHEDATAPATLPYAFSPPVLKSFKHLRRSLVIAESTGEKLACCQVDMAFALDEEESARFARIFGDARVQDCHTDTNSAMSGLWDDRSWLIDDTYEGEAELASFEGLNLFASIAMLRLVNLDSIIGEMSPEQRLSYFANEVGRDRVIRFNHLIETRWRAFASPSTTP